MEHLASDIKNIKESLHRMQNYIKYKSVNTNPNNIKNLDSIGKVVWELLSPVYDLYWDGLYIDDSKMLFRNKVKSKFNLQVSWALVNNKGKEIVKPTYVSPLLPPILVKTPKEVNEISKYFKKNDISKRSHMPKLLPNLRVPMPWWTLSRSKRCLQLFKIKK